MSLIESCTTNQVGGGGGEAISPQPFISQIGEDDDDALL